MSFNNVKTAVLLALLGGFFIVVGGALAGTGGAALGLGLGLAFAGGSYWFSDKLAIKAARARPVSEEEMPEYYAIVRELCAKADMPMPTLYVTPDPQPNAFATGRNPQHAAVAVTAGIVEALSWEEMRGVLAHELSHVRNRDILISSVAAAVAMGVMFLVRIAYFGALFGAGRDRDQNPIVLLASLLLAPLAAMLLRSALSRSREFEADRSGARLLGDGEPLARALEKMHATAQRVPMEVDPAHAQAFIVNPLTGRRVQFRKLFTTHPPVDARVSRLRSREWSH